MGSQMAASCAGILLAPPVFGFLAQKLGTGFSPWYLLGCSSGGEKEYFLNILTGWEGYAILLLPLKGFIFLCKNLAGQLSGQAFPKRIRGGKTLSVLPF
jgi:hypothetical protein